MTSYYVEKFTASKIDKLLFYSVNKNLLFHIA